MPAMFVHPSFHRKHVARPARWFTAFVAAALFTAGELTAQAPGGATATPPSAKGSPERPVDVARLISQLNDDEYRVRQEATRRLARGGVNAVAPLARVAAGNDLESAFRAFAALKELGCSIDPATEEAAFTALEDLAGTAQPTAERAKAVLVDMRTARQERAKERLRELGATVSDPVGNGNDFGGPFIAGGGFGGGVIVARGGVFVGGADGGIYVPGVSIEIGEDWKGTADDLRFVRRVNDVGQIVLSGEKVTDEWIEQIAHVPAGDIKRIELNRTKVTDEGFRRLAGMSSLVRLDVLYTPITDASLDALGQLANVQYVRLYGTKVSAQGADQLASKLPNARIDRRGGALLGVGGSIGERPCVINTVQPDSAAAKAGILEGDVIVTFDGKAVADFTELTAAISEKVGGEKVEIELLRAAADSAEPRAMKRTVTLGAW